MAASPTGTGRTSVALSLIAAVTVPLVVGTVISFGVGFGVLTDCTNAFSCTVTGCAPCRPAGAWLNGGRLAQGVLLLAAAALAIIGRRRLPPQTVRAAGLTIAGLSMLLVVVTTAVAIRSY